MLSIKIQIVSIFRWNYVLGMPDNEMSRDGKLIKVLITGIQYCHEMGVFHRDTKPENIFGIIVGQLKQADFGLSVWIGKGISL